MKTTLTDQAYRIIPALDLRDGAEETRDKHLALGAVPRECDPDRAEQTMRKQRLPGPRNGSWRL